MSAKRIGKQSPTSLGTKRGNTLLEVVFATAVLAVLLVAISGLIPTVMRASRRSQNVLAATHLAQSLVEAAQTLPFPDVTGSYTDKNSNTHPDIVTLLPTPQFAGYPNVTVGNAAYTCSLQVTPVTLHPDGTPRLKQISATVSWDPDVPPVVITSQAYDLFIQ